MNEIGKRIKLKIFGSSHDAQVGIVLSGIDASKKIDIEFINSELARRKPIGVYNTQRKEEDTPIFSSGIKDGLTTGDPIEIIFRNNNICRSDYSQFEDIPRPGHADFVGKRKYPSNDMSGGGIFSGRMTVGLVAAGAILKQLIPFDITSKVISLFNECDPGKWDDILSVAKEKGETVGGIIEVRAVHNDIDDQLFLGEPFFDSVESVLSHYIFAIPGIKGIEFGIGFRGEALYGSSFNDVYIDEHGATATNNSGGINGGISNGNPIVLRVFVRPIPSVSKEQETFNFKTNKMDKLKITGRHDVTIVNRVGVILENVVSLALADLYYRRKNND